MHHIGKRRKKKNKRIQFFAFILISLNIFKLNFKRDGCPKIVNLGSAKTDLYYERKKYGFKKTK